MVTSVCFFFFSSRRRHTRYWRDWSSDVCSSDLTALALGPDERSNGTVRADGWGALPLIRMPNIHLEPGTGTLEELIADVDEGRSEERRVGKECRSRWSPYH